MTPYEAMVISEKSKALQALFDYINETKDGKLYELVSAYVDMDSAYLTIVVGKIDLLTQATHRLKEAM